MKSIYAGALLGAALLAQPAQSLEYTLPVPEQVEVSTPTKSLLKIEWSSLEPIVWESFDPAEETLRDTPPTAYTTYRRMVTITLDFPEDWTANITDYVDSRLFKSYTTENRAIEKTIELFNDDSKDEFYRTIETVTDLEGNQRTVMNYADGDKEVWENFKGTYLGASGEYKLETRTSQEGEVSIRDWFFLDHVDKGVRYEANFYKRGQQPDFKVFPSPRGSATYTLGGNAQERLQWLFPSEQGFLSSYSKRNEESLLDKIVNECGEGNDTRIVETYPRLSDPLLSMSPPFIKPVSVEAICMKNGGEKSTVWYPSGAVRTEVKRKLSENITVIEEIGKYKRRSVHVTQGDHTLSFLLNYGGEWEEASFEKPPRVMWLTHSLPLDREWVKMVEGVRTIDIPDEAISTFSFPNDLVEYLGLPDSFNFTHLEHEKID